MKKYNLYLKIVFLLLIFYFYFIFLKSNFSQLKNYELNFNLPYLFLTFIWLLLSLTFPVFCWKYLLKLFKQNISFPDSLKIWFAANLGRYLPGKIWQITGLVYLGQKKGLEKKALTQSVIYSQLISLISGSSLSFFLLSDILDSKINTLTFKIVIIISNIIFFAFPSILIHLGNLLLQVLKRNKLNLTITRKDFFLYYIMQVINWLGLGFSFYLCTKSLYAADFDFSLNYLFLLPLSWIIGLISIFAPGGIGIREGVLTFLLLNFLPKELAIILPWAHRIIISLVEFFLTIIFSHSYVIKYKNKIIS